MGKRVRRQRGGRRTHKIENVTGSLYDDFLSGNDEENELRGAGGNDTLKGGGGADDLFGGGGNDTASYEDSDDSVFIALDIHIASGGTAQDDTFNSIENLPARHTAISSTATTASTR